MRPKKLALLSLPDLPEHPIEHQARKMSIQIAHKSVPFPRKHMRESHLKATNTYHPGCQLTLKKTIWVKRSVELVHFAKWITKFKGIAALSV